MNTNTVVRRARELLFSQLDDELLAIDARAGYCYSLNKSAGQIWELISSPQPVGAICARLRERYAVDEATCLADVLAVLADLQGAGLVATSDAAVAA